MSFLLRTSQQEPTTLMGGFHHIIKTSVGEHGWIAKGGQLDGDRLRVTMTIRFQKQLNIDVDMGCQRHQKRVNHKREPSLGVNSQRNRLKVVCTVRMVRF